MANSELNKLVKKHVTGVRGATAVRKAFKKAVAEYKRLSASRSPRKSRSRRSPRKSRSPRRSSSFRFDMSGKTRRCSIPRVKACRSKNKVCSYGPLGLRQACHLPL